MAFFDLIGLSPAATAYAVVCMLVAGFVRGFAGFGMSALMVLSLGLVLPPKAVVPSAFMLEVLASLRMLPAVRRDVQWRIAGLLLAGGAVGIPLGIHALAMVPDRPMRIVLSVFVLCVVVVLWTGFRLKTTPRGVWTVLWGVGSGVANGAASFGGQPNAIYLLSSPVSARAVRATLVFMALVTDVYATGMAAWHGLVTPDLLARTALLAVPMAVGIGLGGGHFLKAPAAAFRRFALVLLLVLAGAGLVRALA